MRGFHGSSNSLKHLKTFFTPYARIYAPTKPIHVAGTWEKLKPAVHLMLTHTRTLASAFGETTDVIRRFRQEAKSNRTVWEKWFQTPVILVLITYNILPLSLPSALPLQTSWLQVVARHLSLCHPPYGLLSPSLSEAMETWFLSSVFLSRLLFFLLSFLPLLYLHTAHFMVTFSFKSLLRHAFIKNACEH